MAKKLLAGLLACLMLVPVLAGCSDGSEDSLPAWSEASAYNRAGFEVIWTGLSDIMIDFEANGSYPGITGTEESGLLTFSGVQKTTNVEGYSFDVTINGRMQIYDGQNSADIVISSARGVNATLGTFYVSCHIRMTNQSNTPKITMLVVNGTEYDPYK